MRPGLDLSPLDPVEPTQREVELAKALRDLADSAEVVLRGGVAPLRASIDHARDLLRLR